MKARHPRPAIEVSGAHRAAVKQLLADAPPMGAEQARAIRSLLAGYAERAKEDQRLAESRERPA